MNLKEKICKLNAVSQAKVDLYFDDYNLVREVDEFGHSDINIGYEIER